MIAGAHRRNVVFWTAITYGATWLNGPEPRICALCTCNLVSACVISKHGGAWATCIIGAKGARTVSHPLRCYGRDGEKLLRFSQSSAVRAATADVCCAFGSESDQEERTTGVLFAPPWQAGMYHVECILDMLLGIPSTPL